MPFSAQIEYRDASKAAGDEFSAAIRVADASRSRSVRRTYVRRADRPCRYARSGCTEFAGVGARACAAHAAADAKRHRDRERGRLNAKLAAAQAGACTWCHLSLPEDLTGTHQDHVIPVSRGGPDEEWNRQLLHARCNLVKNDRITPQAEALAAEHGITLAGGRSSDLAGSVAASVEDPEDDPEPGGAGSDDPACSVTITPGWDVSRYFR